MQNLVDGVIQLQVRCKKVPDLWAFLALYHQRGSKNLTAKNAPTEHVKVIVRRVEQAI